MSMIIKNANVFRSGSFSHETVVLSGGRVFSPGSGAVPSSPVVDGTDIYVLPGFADVHVHFREPGFSYKETIRTGSLAAAHGGYTTVCPMPNLQPVPDSAETLEEELMLIRQGAAVRVIPYGAVTKGEKGLELSDMDAMAPHVCGFSDDGKGVQSGDMMGSAMRRAKALGKVIAAHCEDDSLVRGGVIHDGEYAHTHRLPGICSESEWRPIERDCRLAEKTGCAYHVCHVSCAESVELIRQARARGADVTCETAPHYLVLDDSMLQDDGRFKMNPPIRSARDRQALIEGLLDGTIGMIATDHAPHTAEEKSRGLRGSLMGVTGLEAAFPVLYTQLVKTGLVPLETVLRALTDTPRQRFGLPGADDYTVFDLGAEYTIDPSEFLSMGHATPFEGMRVYGRCMLTVCDGRTAWLDPSWEGL